MPPGSAMDCKREAIFTPSPKTSSFSKVTSPKWIPIRILPSTSPTLLSTLPFLTAFSPGSLFFGDCLPIRSILGDSLHQHVWYRCIQYCQIEVQNYILLKYQYNTIYPYSIRYSGVNRRGIWFSKMREQKKGL